MGTMAGSLGGIFFPIFTGKLLDHFKDNPTTGYSILFGYCGLAYVVCFGIHHLLAPKFVQVKLKEA
jgi:ACS family hexuronate transporter-like MFS transporter